MNVRINTLTHRVAYVLDADNVSGHACTPDMPCRYHQGRLVWHVQTWCGMRLHIKGRPKIKQTTCITCIVSAP